MIIQYTTTYDKLGQIISFKREAEGMWLSDCGLLDDDFNLVSLELQRIFECFCMRYSDDRVMILFSNEGAEAEFILNQKNLVVENNHRIF